MKKLLFFILFFMFVSCGRYPEWLTKDYEKEDYVKRAIEWFKEADIYDFWVSEIKRFGRNRAVPFCLKILNEAKACIILADALLKEITAPKPRIYVK